MGLYDGPAFGSLLGLGIGMIFASFHVCGIMFVLRILLYMLVRNVIAVGPRCFRCLMFMLSGPVELLFLADLIAFMVSCSVIVMVVVGSLLMALLVFLLFMSVWCMVTFANCL